MSHKLSDEEYNLIKGCFKDNRIILTQHDIQDITGCVQSAISIALTKLEDEGFICWTRNEGVKQVKFYNRLN